MTMKETVDRLLTLLEVCRMYGHMTFEPEVGTTLSAAAAELHEIALAHAGGAAEDGLTAEETARRIEVLASFGRKKKRLGFGSETRRTITSAMMIIQREIVAGARKASDEDAPEAGLQYGEA